MAIPEFKQKLIDAGKKHWADPEYVSMNWQDIQRYCSKTEQT
jgi:hypothetical protein